MTVYYLQTWCMMGPEGSISKLHCGFWESNPCPLQLILLTSKSSLPALGFHFNSVYMYGFVCGYVHMRTGACEGQMCQSLLEPEL